MADETITITTPDTAQTTATQVTVPSTQEATVPPVDNSAETAKLNAEMAKLKAALDKATKEAGDAKKALRAKQSAEEAAAEEAKEQQEAQAKELAELRKKFVVAETSKKVMGFVGDEAAASEVAEYLYGAEDVDAALSLINKAWTAKEKALRLEYGKIPAPGAGASDGPTLTKEQLDSLSYKERVKFAREHANEYNQLMGR